MIATARIDLSFAKYKLHVHMVRIGGTRRRPRGQARGKQQRDRENQSKYYAWQDNTDSSTVGLSLPDKEGKKTAGTIYSTGSLFPTSLPLHFQIVVRLGGYSGSPPLGQQIAAQEGSR